MLMAWLQQSPSLSSPSTIVIPARATPVPFATTRHLSLFCSLSQRREREREYYELAVSVRRPMKAPYILIVVLAYILDAIVFKRKSCRLPIESHLYGRHDPTNTTIVYLSVILRSFFVCFFPSSIQYNLYVFFPHYSSIQMCVCV